MDLKEPANGGIFISYSHKDESWKDLLVPQLEVLKWQLPISVWHDRMIDGGENWYPEITKAMKDAAVAICLISADYLSSSFIRKEEIPFFLQRRRHENILLIPVLVRPCPWERVRWLRDIQMIPRDGKSIANDFRGREDEIFKNVADLVGNKLDNPGFVVQAQGSPCQELPEDHVYIDRLPQTGTEVFGRNAELGMLDSAWDERSPNILAFVACGGVGKSALVNKWVDSFRSDCFRGAKRAFAWSFYSQGTGEKVTSADIFVNHALEWFGDPAFAKSNRSPWDKGRRLAELVQEEPTLLLLDGMEPLQDGPGISQGAIKDPALAVLLKQLANLNSGLCVVTTRESIKGLGQDEAQIQQHDLEQITPESGRALLRVNKIRGTDSELENVTLAFGNHALAINLLSKYLKDIPGQHVAAAKEIPDNSIPVEKGKHPRRVIEAFANRFGNSPELNLLNIMGLFDRPVDTAEIDFLRKRSSIPAVTDQIFHLSDEEFERVVARLREARLIARPSHHAPGELDTHPLVREHFAQRLESFVPDSQNLAHQALFEFYAAQPIPEAPSGLGSMIPQLQAVTHGCCGKIFQRALDEVFKPRILGENESYSRNKVGGHGAKLSALSGFFTEPWQIPVDDLNEQDQAFVLHHASVFLRALGRLAEVIPPAKAALKLRVSNRNWKDAVRSSGTLAQAQLALGEISESLTEFQRCKDYADLSEHPGSRVASRAVLANALNQSGDLNNALAIIMEAEDLHRESNPQTPLLHSLRGYYYHDILLALGKHDKAIDHSTHSLELALTEGWGLATGLGHLAVGRACLLAYLSGNNSGLENAKEHLNAAVRNIQIDGAQDQIPRSLLARASLFRTTHEFSRCRADLDDVYEIVSRDNMSLFRCDYHLERVRLFLEIFNLGDTSQTPMGKNKILKDAVSHLEMASSLVEGTGYKRRKPEVLLHRAEVDFLKGDRLASKHGLLNAEAEFKTIGIHEWDARVSKLMSTLRSAGQG